MPKITSNPTYQTMCNRRWRAKHSVAYDEFKDGICLWNKESRRFLRILDEYSGRRPQGRPRKTVLA